MKKLNFLKNQTGVNEMLTREQLRNVLGGKEMNLSASQCGADSWCDDTYGKPCKEYQNGEWVCTYCCLA